MATRFTIYIFPRDENGSSLEPIVLGDDSIVGCSSGTESSSNIASIRIENSEISIFEYINFYVYLNETFRTPDGRDILLGQFTEHSIGSMPRILIHAPSRLVPRDRHSSNDSDKIRTIIRRHHPNFTGYDYYIFMLVEVDVSR